MRARWRALFRVVNWTSTIPQSHARPLNSAGMCGRRHLGSTLRQKSIWLPFWQSCQPRILFVNRITQESVTRCAGVPGYARIGEVSTTMPQDRSPFHLVLNPPSRHPLRPIRQGRAAGELLLITKIFRHDELRFGPSESARDLAAIWNSTLFQELSQCVPPKKRPAWYRIP